MCVQPNEHLLVAKRGGGKRNSENAVECYFDQSGTLRIVFYQPFWDKFKNYVGMNDHVRLYVDDTMTYLRMCAQPVKGTGCYKMSKRSNCPSLRQIVLPPSIAGLLPKHEGRKALGVKQENRSIILTF